MREIKFRAWDINAKSYVLLDYPHYDMGFGRVAFRPHKPITGSFELEQYTGLKDKNGKEIYEGDIVRGGWDCETPRVVEFVGGGFEPFTRSSGQDGEKSSWVEVIGNIYDKYSLNTSKI